MDARCREELDLLLYRMLEKEASDQESARLNALLAEDAEALRYAMDFYLVAAALRKSTVIPSASLGSQDEIDEQFHLLKIFAEEERIAPSVELPEEIEEPAAKPVRTQVYRPDRQKTALWVLVASMAALVVFFCFCQVFASARGGGFSDGGRRTQVAEWRRRTEESGFILQHRCTADSSVRDN